MFHVQGFIDAHGKSHEGSTRGINELNFPSVVKGDLIGCLEI